MCSSVCRSGWCAVFYAVYKEEWETVDMLLRPTLALDSRNKLWDTIFQLIGRQRSADNFLLGI